MGELALRNLSGDFGLHFCRNDRGAAFGALGRGGTEVVVAGGAEVLFKFSLAADFASVRGVGCGGEVEGDQDQEPDGEDDEGVGACVAYEEAGGIDLRARHEGSGDSLQVSGWMRGVRPIPGIGEKADDGVTISGKADADLASAGEDRFGAFWG